MKKYNCLLFACLLLVASAFAQEDAWTIKADSINPNNYYGETVANGMMGIVSSPIPFTVKDVVLNGAFDLYGRGRVSNILKTFNFVNMYLDVDGQRIENASQVQHMRQVLDMQHASLTTTLDVGDKASVSYTYYSLRHLPYTALVDVTITAKKDIEIIPASCNGSTGYAARCTKLLQPDRPAACNHFAAYFYRQKPYGQAVYGSQQQLSV